MQNHLETEGQNLSLPFDRGRLTPRPPASPTPTSPGLVSSLRLNRTEERKQRPRDKAPRVRDTESLHVTRVQPDGEPGPGLPYGRIQTLVRTPLLP